MERNELAFAAASKVHQAWCDGEMNAFYGRMVAAHETMPNPGDAVRAAGMKNGAVRNVVEIDGPFLIGHETLAGAIFTDRKAFDTVVKLGGIEVKRFAKRSLTPEEEKALAAKGDCRTVTNPETGATYTEENILKPFGELSADSQKENLEAAQNALEVYEKLKAAGMTDEQMALPENQALIGTAIHTAWMQRNEPTEANSYMFCAYDKLDSWTQGQDLDVFRSVVGAAKENDYVVEPVPGAKIPTLEEIQAMEAAAMTPATEQ